jgi:hypothetical protein
MIADPTVLEVVLCVLAVAIILAAVAGSFDAALLVAAVLGSIALGLLVLADAVIVFYVAYVGPANPNDRLLLVPALLVLLPGVGALFAAVLTFIGVLAGLIWCLRRRHFGGLGFPLMLASLVVELAGVVLITSVEAGAAFVPPLESTTSLGNSAFEAIAVGCMTLAALGLCVGAFVTLGKTRARRSVGAMVPPGSSA